MIFRYCTYMQRFSQSCEKTTHMTANKHPGTDKRVNNLLSVLEKMDAIWLHLCTSTSA